MMTKKEMEISDVYKIRKEVYLYTEFDDVNLDHQYIDMSKEDIVMEVLRFFREGSSLIYPAKSYFVALIYAAAMEKYFKIDFFEALNSSELLFDDQYFVPYEKAQEIYDTVIYCIGGRGQILNHIDTIHPTIDYFFQEFNLKG